MHQRLRGIIKLASHSKWLIRLTKLTLWLFGGIIMLLLCLSLSLLIPSVQKFAVDHATRYLSSKTGMHAKVGSVRISFPKTVRIGNIYIEDQQQDTLLFCKQISVNADLFPLIFRKINIDDLAIEGLKSRVYKNPVDSSFNFSPLVEAFAGQEKSQQGTSAWQLGFDELSLSNIDLSFNSNPDATSYRLMLGNLKIIDDESDPLGQVFAFESIEIGRTSVRIRIDDRIQTFKSETKPLNQQAPPFAISLSELVIEETSFDLDFASEKLALHTFIRKAVIEPEILDLKSQNIVLNEILADAINVAIQIESTESDKDPTPNQRKETHSSAFTFGDIGWDIFAERLKLANSQVQLDLNKLPSQKSGMDYAHLNISDLNIEADSIYFNKNATGLSVSSLSVSERSGARIEDLNGFFALNNHEIVAQNVALKTPGSYANGSIKLSYPTLQTLGQEISSLGISSQIEVGIRLKELKPFTTLVDHPILKNLEYIQLNRFETTGSLDNLKIDKANLAFGKSSFLKGSSKIAGISKGKPKITYCIDTALSVKSDYSLFLPDPLLPSGLNLPETISLSSVGSTNLSDLQANLNLSTDAGRLYLQAQLLEQQLVGDIELTEVDIGKVLNDSIYGKISLNSHVEGTMSSGAINKLSADVKVKTLDFKNYQYENGQLNVDWSNDQLGISAAIADSALAATLVGNVVLLDSSRNIQMDLHLQEADLHRLNLFESPIKVSGTLKADVDIRSANDFRGLISMGEISMANDDNAYTIDTVIFNSDINSEYTNFQLDSEILKASLTGNTRINELKYAMIDHLDLYIHLPDSIVSDKNFEFEFNLELKDDNIFTQFLIDDLNEIQLEKCFLRYDDEDDELTVQIDIPVLDYKGILFQQMDFDIDSNADIAKAGIKVNSLKHELGEINHLEVESEFDIGQADILFKVQDLDERIKYRLNAIINYEDSLYRMSLNPNSTVIDYKSWMITEENLLQFTNGKFSSNPAIMSQGDQKISMSAVDDRIRINLEKFGVQNIADILEFDSTRTDIDGQINGFIEITDLFNKIQLNTELEIPELLLDQKLLGNLETKAYYSNTGQTSFDLKLKNEANYILGTGRSTQVEGDTPFNLLFEVNINEPNAFESLLNQYVEDLEGAFSGRLSLQIQERQSNINGNLLFDNLHATYKPTNSDLTATGKLIFDDNQLQFESFKLIDSLGNPLTVSGFIDAENLSEPLYDVKLEADKFLAINSNSSHDPNLYGQLLLGTDITIKGKQSALNVNSSFAIVDGTDLIFVMPGKDLELITDEGIVEFVDLENPDLEVEVKKENQFVGDSIVALISGIDLTTNLNVDPNAKFTIVVDPNSGDYTQFSFDGRLQYKYNEDQRGMLTGLVEMREGFYELSFYGLVKKRFNYDPGSTVSWGGEVMDGEINFSARHTVRTNSVGLVSNEISTYERAMYNQRLPYDVILKVQNKISEPSILFEIDLPRRNRNAYPTIDAKLNMLNQPNMESERNKQVFALLVGGTFIPENPDVSEGSSSDNFATTAARNSVNAIMTQQLNKLTGQVIRGFDVDMGMNTFDDYAGGSAQTRTQLDVKVSKNLFNDRVSAEMESHIDLDGSVKQVAGQNTAGMTEFAVSYKLTETGNYRIKAFRENAYDIYDGEIQNSGIAFIFVKEFDSLRKQRRTTVDADPDQETEKEKADQIE